MITPASSPPKHNQVHEKPLLDEYQLINVIQHLADKSLKRWQPSTWEKVMKRGGEANGASPDTPPHSPCPQAPRPKAEFTELAEFCRITIIDLLNEKLIKEGKPPQDVNDFSYLNGPQNGHQNASGSQSSNSDVEMQQWTFSSSHMCCYCTRKSSKYTLRIFGDRRWRENLMNFLYLFPFFLCCGYSWSARGFWSRVNFGVFFFFDSRPYIIVILFISISLTFPPSIVGPTYPTPIHKYLNPTWCELFDLYQQSAHKIVYVVTI